VTAAIERRPVIVGLGVVDTLDDVTKLLGNRVGRITLEVGPAFFR